MTSQYVIQCSNYVSSEVFAMFNIEDEVTVETDNGIRLQLYKKRTSSQRFF